MSTRPKFYVELRIYRLAHIPMSTGQVHVKWFVKDSAKPDARGKTPEAVITDHKAEWDYSATTKARIRVGSDGYLKPAYLVFEVVWDQGGSGRVNMGKVELNISEQVGRGRTGDRDPVMKVLLRDSRVNSVLHVEMKPVQYKGTTEYRVPDLTTPQLFGDITGVINEQRTRAAERNSDRSSESRDHASISRLYHRTFAVVWDTRPGDLDPESCIEDIFAGGDGFSHDYDLPSYHSPSPASRHHSSGSNRSLEPPRRRNDARQVSRLSVASDSNHSTHNSERSGRSGSSGSNLRRTSSNANTTDSQGRRYHESEYSDEDDGQSSLLRELDARDDFRTWQIPVSQ